jgi:hypothetical protein
VKLLADSCLQYEQCRKGLEQSTLLPSVSPARHDPTLIRIINFFISSHNGCVIQRVQVAYVARVTPIPENLDSHEAASFLCAERISCYFVAMANIDNHMYMVPRIPRVEVQPNKSRRLDCTSWSWRRPRPRISWFAPSIITSPYVTFTFF